VRTILSINDEGNMIFAGDLPEGSKVRFMKANMDRLIDAANAAAEACLVINSGASLAIIVSCVGRKLVLGERIAEEVEIVRGIGKQNNINRFLFLW
jgi:hypothetical protein